MASKKKNLTTIDERTRSQNSRYGTAYKPGMAYTPYCDGSRVCRASPVSVTLLSPSVRCCVII